MKDFIETQRMANIGTWRIDLATNHVTWSKELFDMYASDLSVPPPLFAEQKNMFSSESWEKLMFAMDSIKATGKPFEMELQTIARDGSTGWMWARGEAERDFQGNIIAIWGAAQNITERKKTEFELKSSEEKFQLLFNKAPLGYQSLDSDGHFLEVNQKWLDTLGYAKKEVIGKWFGDFLSPDYVEGFRKRFPIFKSQGHIHSEFEMMRKDGQKIFIAFDGKIGYDAEGKFKQTHCILQDITNQRAAEKALQESEERYKFLFEYSGIAIIYFAIDGTVISINKRAVENMGGKLEDYIGKSLSEFVPEKDAVVISERLETVIRSDQPIEYEDYALLPSGERWFFSTYTRVLNRNGEPIGIQVSLIDITERKKAEGAAFESRAILEAAYDNSQAGVVIVDSPDGKIRYVNKAGLSILDISEDELAGIIDLYDYLNRSKMYHLNGEPYKEEEVPLVRAILRGENCNDEMVIRKDHEKDVYLLANASPIKDSDNNIKAGIVVFIDITDKMMTEESVNKQNELLSSLLKLLPVGVFMVDAKEGKPLVANETAKILMGRGILPEANEKNLSEVYKAYKKSTHEQYPASEMPITLGMKGISAHIEDMIVERPDGTKIQLEVFGSPVMDMQGSPWASLVTFIDITERKKAENELIYLSYHDHLTGFYNRRYFENELLEMDKPENLPFSIIICDINGLKLINDSFGHVFGDELLVKAAEIIKAASRPDDIICRIGGDEFAVLLPKTDADIAMQIANNIKQLSAKEKVANIELSISYGYDTKTVEKLNMIEVLANAENHMYRHKLYERSSMRSKTIDIIMNTLFEKSNRESMHSNRVSSICMAIAANMNFDDDDINKIRIAGLVHDIGKIGIDEKILNKPGRLDDDERDQINKHPEVGWRILSSATEFAELANFILDHHERWDGKGYPNGLAGENIPLVSRIISVADSFDAMTSERSYRSGLSQEEAISELRRCSGSQFDPEIVDVFVDKVIPKNIIS